MSICPLTRKKPILNFLDIYSEPTFMVGYHKDPGLKGFFKPAYPVATYREDNPYIHIDDMIHIEVTGNDKFYQTNWFKIGGGILGGICIDRLFNNAFENQ